MKRDMLVELRDIPVHQNRLFASHAEAVNCRRGDLLLVQDTASGLVVNAAFDGELLEYGGEYQNEQAHSDAFKEHLRQVLGIIDAYFHGSSIVEVGCGKGYFLNLMRAHGFSAVGVDPAFEGVESYVIKAAFDKALGVKADGVVLRHVLEHISDPVHFLRELADSNQGGLIYVEVPCFDWIRRHRAWFDLFYEHVNYFRLEDFERIFERVVAAGHLFSGQYLYVVADLSSIKPSLDVPPSVDLSLPPGFFQGIEKCAALSKTGTRNIVWGAGAKGVMFSQHVVRAGGVLDFAVDINPAKHGRFMAGTGVPVLSPDEGLERLSHGDTVFVLNSVYLNEIKQRAGKSLNFVSAENHE